MRASYEATGEDPLRSDPTTKSGSATPSPSGSGKDMGGTENLGAETQTKTGSTTGPGTYSRDVKPAGVAKFYDMAKE
jgi:hypothetical protein